MLVEIWLVVLPVIIMVVWCVKLSGHSSSDWPNKPTLLITAHPDDECMFFAPTIIHLLANNQKLFLLCLSEGDYYGSGTIRKLELNEACEIFGLSAENIIVINDSKLQDNPRASWPTEIIGNHVMKAVGRYNIKRIITFDKVGVSGHLNHIAIYQSVRKLSLTQKEIQEVEVMYLKSTQFYRKYSSFIEAVLTQVFDVCQQRDHFVISSFNEWLLAQRALSKHKTQMVWYRQIYRLLSNYLLINRYTSH